MEAERKTSRADVEHLDLETLMRRPSLRASIPRRVSQVRREAVPAECTSCGVGCVRGEWLQSFANRKTYVFLHGVLGSFYGSSRAYFYGSITTLEKAYGIPSLTLGTIATVSDLSQVVTSVILSLIAQKLHKPRWIAFGAHLVVVSTVVLSLPHFLYGPANPSNRLLHENDHNKTDTLDSKSSRHLPDEDKPCWEEPEACVSHPSEEPLVLLVLAQILHGIGGAFYFTLGGMYHEENIRMYQAPSLLSLLSTLKILGPTFGYWLSSLCLKIFVSPNVTHDLREEEVAWIGAWWLGNLIIGFLLLLPGVMVMLFPRTLPKAALRKVFNEAIEMTQSGQNTSDVTEKTPKKSFFTASTLNCNNNFGTIFNILGFMPHFIFLPKYVETQYRLSPGSANLITGSVTLISSACGMVVASSVITRYRPPARALVGWKVFVTILSIGSLVFNMNLGCQGNDKQIKELVTQYSVDVNITCGCRNISLSPVCTKSGETFISPCHAQCKGHDDLQVITNCSDILLQSSIQLKGACPVDCYFNFIIFIIVTSSTSFIYATGYSSNFWLETKYTEKHNKSDFFHFGMALFGLLTFVSAQIIFGFILDKSCVLWNESCDQNGNCWFYDTESLRTQMNLVAAGFVVIGIINDVRLMYVVKDIDLFDDDQYMEESEEY